MASPSPSLSLPVASLRLSPRFSWSIINGAVESFSLFPVSHARPASGERGRGGRCHARIGRSVGHRAAAAPPDVETSVSGLSYNIARRAIQPTADSQLSPLPSCAPSWPFFLAFAMKLAMSPMMMNNLHTPSRESPPDPVSLLGWGRKGGRA